MRLPLTVITPTENVSAFTRDLSNTGVYFYVSSEQLELISREFECLIEFPAEITMSASQRMYFKGTVLRMERRISGEVGLAAKLCKVEARDRC